MEQKKSIDSNSMTLKLDKWYPFYIFALPSNFQKIYIVLFIWIKCINAEQQKMYYLKY